MLHIRCVLRVLKVFSWNSSPPFLKGSVLVIALAFCVVLLYIFILVSCCGLCYDFCIHTMFNSCLPLVVGRRARAYCGVCGCLRILMSNMLSYNMFLSSELRVVMSTTISPHTNDLVWFVFFANWLLICYLCLFDLYQTRIDYISYKGILIGIWYFSAKHTAVCSKNTNWLIRGQSQNNLPAVSDMSVLWLFRSERALLIFNKACMYCHDITNACLLRICTQCDSCDIIRRYRSSCHSNLVTIAPKYDMIMHNCA